jgi:RHS repeat-associated protein
MSRFDLVSGRLILSLEKGMSDDTLTQASADQPFITRYDASGNVTWRARYEFDRDQMQSEQRSYYAADQMLRATDVRYWDNTGREHMAFEEYAYDALGRRMGVRTRQFCYGLTEATVRGDLPRVDCHVSTMRRILWDGDAELGEIQMPGGEGEDLERDSLALDYRDPTFPLSNIEPFFGRVAYVYAGSLDQPLAVTRFGYQTLTQSGQTIQSQAVPTFTFYPLWNSREVADNVSHLGAATPCQYTQTDYPSGAEPGARPSRACVRYDVADNVWLPYRRVTGPKGAWHGSLVEDKRDASGLLYRRNRYYDPMTGRFTQEDPIGVAGGINLYGFADGDPVSYSDPFGLWPDWGGLKDGMRDWWHDVKRDAGIRIIKVIIDLAGLKEGEKIEPIDPGPPPPEYPAPTKPKDKKESPKKPDASPPNPFQRFRNFWNQPVGWPMFPPLVPPPSTGAPVWLPPVVTPLLLPE